MCGSGLPGLCSVLCCARTPIFFVSSRSAAVTFQNFKNIERRFLGAQRDRSND